MSTDFTGHAEVVRRLRKTRKRNRKMREAPAKEVTRMRVLQIAIVKLLSGLTMLSGGALVAVWVQRHRTRVDRALHGSRGLDLLGDVARGRPGWTDLSGGFSGPAALDESKTDKSTISFSGSHGEVTIQLDSVEATLARVVSKMPFVKKIWVRVIPSEDNHRAHVSADVWIYKNAESTSGARDHQ